MTNFNTEQLQYLEQCLIDDTRRTAQAHNQLAVYIDAQLEKKGKTLTKEEHAAYLEIANHHRSKAKELQRESLELFNNALHKKGGK